MGGWAVVARHTAEAWTSERPWLSSLLAKEKGERKGKRSWREDKKAGRETGREERRERQVWSVTMSSPSFSPFPRMHKSYIPTANSPLI